MSTSAPEPTAYWEYIQVEPLLRLQSGFEEDEGGLANEEVLFITVHQVFELWFKLVFRELKSARDLFHSPRVEEQELSGVVARLRRARTIFQVAVRHFEVIETLGTREYLEFRTKLMPASGFQSAGLRKIEIMLGLHQGERIALGEEGDWLATLRNRDGTKSSAYEMVEETLRDGPSLKEAVEEWLVRTPIDGTPHDDPHAEERLREFIERFLEAHAREVAGVEERAVALADSEADAERMRSMYAAERAATRAFLTPAGDGDGPRRARARAAMVFIETYRDLPLLSWPREVLAALLEFEQAFLIFRQRHARMVERVIGRRTGTGGSSGVAYLDETALRYRVFDDLWAVRTLMLSDSAAPELERADYYSFKSE